jgi:hypothetical protein
MLEPHPLPAHVSFSAKNAYMECGERFRLEKVYKIPIAPGWWNVGGTAVHTLTELHDRKMMGQDVEIPPFPDAFEIELERVLSKPENEGMSEDDFRSAKKGTENKDFWLRNGPRYVENYLGWRVRAPWDIVMIGDEPAIELPLQFQLLDGTLYIGYVDRLYQMRDDKSFIVVDVKSGANKPATSDQLVDYAVGIHEQYGINPTWGTFVDVRNGQNSALVPTRRGNLEDMTYVYGGFRAARNDGFFLPNRGGGGFGRSQCVYCPVKDYCYAAGGGLANEVPRPWEASPLVIRPPYDSSEIDLEETE